ncbi:hypothetical protein ASPWEDRAFT_171014 [Aspergillus wentii DTO 134E9]|uniref:DUF3669 domain-containing protein n=1 Tax=Aspergillus wentii DTO 134E9 TaxID=1073089 RepID=A0A1L9RRU0_ASPWE|nr:uncharacterized protein ASPWEDRAFT_171014 [Aspergillus wentii DTO 134E9]KAI9930389.1 hypothetical protein MW887_011142 [Aspergillus wentii]OJJ37547.1 hypothetical protein ASPWEDRAFT_171014 [Aspergillus wentii DTO 134E9]
MNSFHRIGAGFCGTVWTSSSEPAIAYKREDGGPSRSLHHDYTIHKLIESKLQLLRENTNTNINIQIHLPKCHRFISPSDPWWTTNLPRFPEGSSPCNVIEVSRIPAIPRATRETLISKYCPATLQDEIFASATNRDCLIRPYLGRRLHTPTSKRSKKSTEGRFQAFSLRNYPLHLDQMEELELGESGLVQWYATVMGETLAILHWGVGVDANDVEFVLAPPPSPSGDGQTATNPLGEHTMWILDFDLCRTISMDEDGVRQAVKAYWGNDPFFPRPGLDAKLWGCFREGYLSACLGVVGDSEGDERVMLSRMFVGLVEMG